MRNSAFSMNRALRAAMEQAEEFKKATYWLKVGAWVKGSDHKELKDFKRVSKDIPLDEENPVDKYFIKKAGDLGPGEWAEVFPHIVVFRVGSATSEAELED